MAEERRSVFEEGVFSVNQVAGTRDPDTGVYWGLYGTQPSENEEAEEQFSAARAAAAVGGFRIYHDSTDTDLQFSVTAGMVIFRGQVVSYAGAKNISLSGGNDVAHYVFLTLPDAILTVDTAWPATPHLRIAVITPTGGIWNWAGFVDHRRTGVFRAVGEPSGGSSEVMDLTAPVTLTDADSQSVLTNLGTIALVEQPLPAAAAGLEFSAVVRDADGLKLIAAAGDKIRIGTSLTPAAGYISATELGASVRLVAVDDTEWVAIGAPQGTWTVST